jgi:hypothetical protein
VLVPTRLGRRRDREWISDELFQTLDAFEHGAGHSDTGGARSSPSPARRPRPSRRSPPSGVP